MLASPPRVIEEYKVSGWAGARILESVEGKLLYQVVEPPLIGEAGRIYELASRRVFEDVELLTVFYELRDFDEAVAAARRIVGEVASEYKSSFPAFLTRRSGGPRREDLEVAAYYLARDLVGYGRLDPLIRDPRVEDITCNGLNIPVYVFHSDYEWLETSIAFTDAGELEKTVYRLAYKAGVEPSTAQPIVEGVLQPEGYRVHIVLDAVSPKGHTFTVRRFRETPFTIIDLMGRGMLESWLAALLWMAVESKIGVVFYGVTGAGKTTLLNAAAMMLPPEYKVVSVEDTPEINLPFHENWVRLVSRLSTEPTVQNVTLQYLVESAMRQRPEVLIVGEIRSREAYTFFQAVSTGHGGLTTIHAEDPVSLVRRLSSPPMSVPKSFVASARLYVGVSRIVLRERVARRIFKVHEVVEYDPGSDYLKLRELAAWVKGEDKWVYSQESETLEHIADLKAVPVEEVRKDYYMRATVLEYAYRSRLDLLSLQALVRRYRRDPVSVYREAAKSVGGGEEPVWSEGEMIIV